jgi:uncharacterized membrane protein
MPEKLYNKKNKTEQAIKAVAAAGALTALTVVSTVFTRIPTLIPQGYFNLGDTVVLVAAAMFGAGIGGSVGAIGSALADIFSGAFLFAPITFIIKGAEGFIVGSLFSRNRQSGIMLKMAAGAAVMAIGYFLAEAFILPVIDPAFGAAAAITELPVNLLQGGASAVIAGFAFKGLKRVRVFKN